VCQFGMGSYIGVPLRVDRELYGTLCFFSRRARPQPWTSADREFMQLIANNLAAAMERSRTQSALVESNRALSLLNAVSRAATSSRSPEELAEALARELRAFITVDAFILDGLVRG